jgi:DNA (cytosine-5)-methyltransferase 1
LPLGPSAAEAIGDLPDADGFNALIKSDEVRTNSFGDPSAYAAEMRCQTNDGWHFGYVRDWDPSILTSSARTNHTEISRLRYSETEPGTVEPISRFFKLSEVGVANTLRAGTDGARGAFTSPRPIHYQHNRCVTVREMARLHGFPDWFRFNATKWHGARQIGNSVPPPLARAVATEVIKALGVEARPAGIISPGDVSLLNMDLSSASAHFGVAVPASRRDRKSGAKKRNQVDIEKERLAAQASHG